MNIRSHAVSQTAVYVVLAAVSAFTLFPFLWMLTNMLKPTIEIMDNRILPSRLTLEHFRSLSSALPIWRNAFNSLFVALAVTAGSLFFSSLVAYGLAKIDFIGRKALHQFIILTMVVPGSLTLVPRVMVVKDLGWMDSYWALIVPALVSAYNVFFFRQFFMGIPSELNQSAYVDGASEFRIYARIIVPLAKPAMITLGILSFLSSWNDFMWPLMVTTSTDLRTLPVVVALLSDQYNTNWGEIMTIGSITAVPITIAYIAFQKYFIEGLVTAGLKM
ncbi:carbohydrate ABC transporter permease [Paenibacillus nasutitermitis]|uniref:Sugar ABC transporter permease n=1 Tax=Paenibacillus nasutitermitis TaxID=1652958 RepID=A0A916ZA28_9BACL|nr:carbohydrate ABC transporter permease [Paenibacillus nasutitermitis]GGD82318.1 sugar ABC transporter permease [Paenibacillus nasutitermitis]